MPVTSPVRLSLLGGWRIVAAGTSWDVPSRAERALLLMLALAQSAGVHARTLIEGAWGNYWQLRNDYDSLHHRIARLRRFLADTNHSIVVNYSRDWYRLDLRPGDTVDIADFFRHLTSARRLLAGVRTPDAVRHAMCHQVAALRLWCTGGMAAAMPPGTDPRAVRRGAERLDAQRRELLTGYAELAARHGPHVDLPAHHLVPAMVECGVGVSPLLLRDLIRGCDAGAVDDLIMRLGGLSTRHHSARRLVTEALWRGLGDLYSGIYHWFDSVIGSRHSAGLVNDVIPATGAGDGTETRCTHGIRRLSAHGITHAELAGLPDRRHHRAGSHQADRPRESGA